MQMQFALLICVLELSLKCLCTGSSDLGVHICADLSYTNTGEYHEMMS